jgi:SAM-dependent MidA family methyltransferase
MLADKIIENHQGSELVIYEVGGGNGTLMDSILDRIRQIHPHLYNRTHYTLIDIYPPTQQLKVKLDKHGPAQVVGQSIFDYQEKEIRPCHVLAMEVVVRPFE